MTTGNARLARAMMTSASIAALCALAPQLASAQSVVTGAPGQALTAGTVTTSTGTVNDFGPGTGLYVYPADSGVVTIDSATLATTGTNVSGAYVASNTPGAGQLDVNLLGANSITSPSSAVNIKAQGASVILDTRAGGSTLTSATGYGLDVTSASGDVTILNGANTINGGLGGIFGGANGAGRDTTILSNGGTITAIDYGIVGQGFYSGGDVVIGGVGGMTSAISLSSPTGIGVNATATDAGDITVVTGVGGTIHAGNIGVLAATNGSGDVTVNIGAAIGATLAPNVGVLTQTSRGSISVNATAAIVGKTSAIAAVAGTVNPTTAITNIDISSGSLTATGSAVSARIAGGTGNLNYTLNGPSALIGGSGVSATNLGTGNVVVTSRDAASSIVSLGVGISARASRGNTLIDFAGSIEAGGDIIAARTSLTGGITIRTTGALSGSNGVSAATANTALGPIDIVATGPITARDGFGILAFGPGAITITSGTVTALQGRGMEANGRGGLVTINAGGPVAGGYSGIRATNTVGSVVISSASTVSANNGVGIFASAAGDVSIAAGAVTSTAGVAGSLVNDKFSSVTADNGFGVVGLSGTGKVTIDAKGPVIGGAAGGVLAQTTTGDIAINLTSVTASNGRGIEADSTGGSITINASGAITGATRGVYAETDGTGTITIKAAGPVIGGSSLGIVAETFGHGTIDIEALGGVTAGTTGIFAASAGDVKVTAETVTAATRGIVAATQGVDAKGSILVTTTGPIVANSGFGIVAYNEGKVDSHLTVNAAGSITSAGGSGISAQTFGGDISIQAAAVIANSAANGTWDAIFAEGYADNSIAISTSGAIKGTNVGIDALLNSATTRGVITVSAAGPIQGGRGVVASSTGVGGITLGSTLARLGPVTGTNGAGIFASGAGDISIATGAVTAIGGTTNLAAAVNANTLAPTSFNGFGIAAVATGGGKITINAADQITGGASGGVLAVGSTGKIDVVTSGVTAASGRAIEANTTTGAISLTANGAVDGATTGIFAQGAGPGAIAINASGPVRGGTVNGISANNSGTGSVTIGSINGRIGALTGGTTGIFAASQGDVTVHASQVTAGTRGIVAASQGASPNGVVTVSTSGAIVGNASFGIVAVNQGRNAGNSITINTAGPVTSTGGSGISAQTQNGDITVTTGAVTAQTGPNGTWDGIFADGRGDSLVKVTTTGPVSGTFNGVEAFSSGTTARSGIDITTGGAVTGGAAQSAIIANLVGQGGIKINTATGGLLTSLNGHGIRANTTGAAGVTDITINNLSAIGAVGGAVRYGIVAQVNDAANAGSVTVSTADGAIVATDFGIAGKAAGSGAVTLTSGSAITTTGVGLYGSTTSGALTITTTAGGKIAPGAAIGIDAQTTTGAILINQAGDIGVAGAGGTVGMGIRAQIASGASNLTVNSTGRVYVTAGAGLQSAGIYAVHGGTGAVNVTSSGVIDPGAYGVVIQGGGAVSYAANGGVVEGDVGAYIASTGAGPVVVTSAAGTQINGFNGAGVDISSVGGGVSFNNAGNVVGATSGVLLATSGAGGVNLVTSGAVTGQTGQGVSAIGGTGVTSVVVNGSVSGATTGVFASSTGAGSTVVTTNGPVLGAATSGITVNSGTGGLTLNVNANVLSAAGPAINATSAAGGVINIAANAVVAGQVNAADTAVINLATASGTTSTINVAKGAVVQSASGSVFNVAIRATGGSVVVNNSGVLSGRVDFSALTGDNVGQIASAAGTSFETGGLSVFGAGNDNFVNAGQLVALGALTTFDFRGGTNVFTNNGTTFVGFNPVNPTGSSFVLTSLTTFNNAGVLEMANGIAGDSIIATGANYIGTGAARLSIDTNLGAPGGLSDRLTIGSSAGRTAVRVRDTSAGFSSLNTAGTLVVAGTTHAGDFVLDAGSSWYNADLFGGAIDKPGLFFSQLAVDGARGTVLVSAPKVQAYQFATLGAQAQTLWHATVGDDQRRADLRDALDPAAADLAASRPGFWVKADIAGADRQATQSFKSLGTTYGYDAGYAQGLVTLTAGYDGVMRASDGGHAFGASLGFVGSDTDFEQAASRTHMQGFVGSGYASLVKGGMFVSASVGGSSLTAAFDAPRLTGYARQETDITAVGGSLEAGLRHAVLGAILEPSLGLAYVNATIGDITAAGSTFRFDDAESLRASLGARLSGDLKSGEAWTVRYAVSLRAVEELSGENGVTVVNAGSALKIEDQVFDSTFGELSAGLVGESRDGWTAFGDAKVRFNDLYTETGVSLGARLKF